MKKALLILPVLVLMGQGCLFGPNDPSQLSCETLQNRIADSASAVSQLETRIASQTEECETYPVKYSDAAAAGASQTELDAIVGEHELCLAGVEDMIVDLEEEKDRLRVHEINYFNNNCNSMGESL